MVKRTNILLLLLCCIALLGNRCAGGKGSGGSAPRVLIEEPAECAAVPGAFPAGFAWLPGSDGLAAVVADEPSAVLFFDMNGTEPKRLERDEIIAVPTDSDGDGENDDDVKLCGADLRDEFVSMGKALGVTESVAFVAGSGYEQIMFFQTPDGSMLELDVENPADTASGSYHGQDYPYLPAINAPRTAVSTKACIYLTDDTAVADATSLGSPVGQHPCCDRVVDVPSFVTTITAGLVIADGHMFVATANLDRPNGFRGSYFPGTVLVYDVDFDAYGEPTSVRPNTETPVIYSTGFNPTGLAHYRTPRGRDLVLVTNSGALRLGVGASNILTDSYIDVIDAASRRLVATIPMGRAGLNFEAVAVDPAERVGLIGSWTLPVLYGIDLRPMDNEDLYEQDEVIFLDGSDPVFPDARIFEADTPFEIPDREGGPHPISCNGQTYAAINQAGEKAYVIEQCDGTLNEIDLLPAVEPCVGGEPEGICCDEIPLRQSCFSLGRIRNVTAPFNEPIEMHGASQITVRPGEPQIDYTGPDVFFLVGLPDGLVCSEAIDSTPF
ncbi:MAG: hypothetical protein ACI9QQ_000179 [Myxococcota bacterium]|jgi:hypothetical protein